MLAVHAPDPLRAAVSTGDLVALTKVPGIGKKGAERIVLELRDKIGAARSVAAGAARPPRRRPTRRGASRSREALVGLGWSAKQADDAVDEVGAERRRRRRRLRRCCGPRCGSSGR